MKILLTVQPIKSLYDIKSLYGGFSPGVCVNEGSVELEYPEDHFFDILSNSLDDMGIIHAWDPRFNSNDYVSVEDFNLKAFLVGYEMIVHSGPIFGTYTIVMTGDRLVTVDLKGALKEIANQYYEFNLPSEFDK